MSTSIHRESLLSIARRISKRHNKGQSIKASLRNRFLDLLSGAVEHLPKWLFSKPVVASAMAAVFVQPAQAGDPVYAQGIRDPFGLMLWQNSDSLALWDTRFADIDSDGDQDLIGLMRLPSFVNNNTLLYPYKFFINTNTGSRLNPIFSDNFVEIIQDSFHLDFNAWPNFDLGDLDNDGDLDILMAAADPGLWIFEIGYTHFFYFENSGTPNTPIFETAVANPFNLDTIVGGMASSGYNIDMIDFDADNDLDMLAAPIHPLGSWDDYRLLYYKNNGSTSMPSFESNEMVRDSMPPSQTIMSFNTYVTDYDMDGDIDVVNMGGGSHYFDNQNHYYPGFIFRNNGTPEPFGRYELLKNLYIQDLIPSPFLNQWYSETAFADLDGDGDDDLIGAAYLNYDSTYNASNGFYFLENLGHSNNTITGTCFLDVDSNGIQDSTEEGLPNVVVSHQMNGGFDGIAITDTAGKYLFPALDTIINLKAVAPNSNFTVLPAEFTIDAADSNYLYTRDFAIQAVANIQDLSVDLAYGTLRRGFGNPFWIVYKNEGSQYMSGSIALTIDELLTYIGGSQTPASQVGNVITWNFTNLRPLEIARLYAELHVSMDAVLDDSISTFVTITPVAGDIYPDNNLDTLTERVRGSYDPNDKVVSPSGDGINGNIAPETGLLEYTIRFQNTGTDTAFNIVVKDSLDGDFDLSTLKILASSHPVNSTTRNGNTLKFTFNNIQLPDSNVNEPASHGFIKYSIKPKAGLPVGSQFHNTAGIYFDYNEPVLTNTTINTLFVPTGVAAHYNNTYRLFPNPMHTKAVLHFDNISKEKYVFKLMDMSGKVMWQTIAEKDRVEIDRNALPPGMYVFTLEGNSDKTSGKLVIE